MSTFLREYIELILQEEAVAASDAAESGLSLVVFRDSRCDTYLLYDGNALLEKLKKLKEMRHVNHPFAGDGPKYDVYDAMLDSTYGMIKTTSPVHPSWNAAEVVNSAAKSGYGPLMYDIAMKISGGIISDRDSVSRTARRVWKYYLNNREDVVAKPLDNVFEPQTRTKQDDSYVYNQMDKKNDPLNHAYFIKHGPNVSALVANHKRTVKEINKTEYGKYFTKSLWSDVAVEFFSDHYH